MAIAGTMKTGRWSGGAMPTTDPPTARPACFKLCVDEVRKRTSEGRKKVFETSQDQYVSLQGILAWDWTSQKQSYVKIRSVRELEASCWDHMRGNTHVEGHCRTKEAVDLIVANVRKIPQKSWRVR